MKIIPLLGLFGTGTNYARTLLENNYEATISYDSFGWKHGLIATYSNQSAQSLINLSPLVIVQDAYSAIHSWYEYYRKNGRNLRSDAESFAEFIRSRIIFYDESAKIKSEYSFSSPIEMWNCVIHNHLSFAKQLDGHVVKYEDLLLNPEETSQKIAQWFGIQRKTDEFIVPRDAARNTEENTSSNSFSDYVTRDEISKKAFFAEKAYLKAYENSDLEIMSASLNKNLINGLSYQIENKFSDCEIFTVANDYMAKQLATLLFSLKQNSGFDLDCVRVIPFNDDIEKVTAICSAFNVTIVKPSQKWDRLGQFLFKDEEYRPRVPAWRYLRKLNALTLAKGKFLFMDANSLVLSSLFPVFNALLDHDVIFGNYSAKNRNFKEPLKRLLNSTNPKIKTGINAGFWASKFDPQFNNFLQNFIGIDIRPCLTRSPEQSVLSLGWALSQKKISKIDEVCGDLSHASSKNEVEQKNGFVVINRNQEMKKVIAMKWTGNAMSINDSMPNKDLYCYYLRGAMAFLTQANPEVFEEMTQSWLSD